MNLFNRFKKHRPLKPMFKNYIAKQSPMKAIQWTGINQKEVSLFTQGKCKYFEDLVLIYEEHRVAVVRKSEWITISDFGSFNIIGKEIFEQYYMEAETDSLF